MDKKTKRAKIKKNIIAQIFLLILIVSFFCGTPLSIIQRSGFYFAKADTDANESDMSDEELYEKYKKYLGYERRKKYRKYKEYKEKYRDKYGFDDQARRIQAKANYKQYKICRQADPNAWGCAQLYDDYKKYKKYKKYYKAYKQYAKYKKYNKSKYSKSRYAKYGKSKYKNGYNRYKRSRNNQLNLGGGSLGPEITVGLWDYSKSQLADDSFRVSATHNYSIKDKNGNVIATVAGSSQTRIKRTDGKTLRIYHSIGDTYVDREVHFEAASAADEDNIIFNTYPAESSFDDYRGKIKIAYSSSSKSFWVINTIKLEPYIWGMGEITGTGDMDYNRVMTVAYRTYGYWKIKYSTKYADYGFKVTNDSGSQIYYGYDWETGHSRIKNAAIDTRGEIMMHGHDIAISPYSSWTDGRTRSFKSRWGSDEYPWCKSVSDPYGKHPSMSTSELEAAGNHMVGLSAHGALTLAGDHNWNWGRILEYYFDDVSFSTAY